VLVLVLAMSLLLGARLGATEKPQTSGKLIVPPDRPLIAFCTDPAIERVLTQDFQVAKREAQPNDHSVLAITVTTSQQVLKPGVSLGHLAPGNPEVAKLLKAAGATPPPLGDTGSQTDRAAVASYMAKQRLTPNDTPMQNFLNQFQTEGNLGPDIPCSEERVPQPGCIQATPKPQPGAADYRGDLDEYMHRTDPGNPFHPRDAAASFDTVIVARVSVSGSPDEMTVVTLVHPGEDVVAAKTLVAEEIANAVLH
jgi:hypothetical protein